jgi:hypothetical protein
MSEFSKNAGIELGSAPGTPISPMVEREEVASPAVEQELDGPLRPRLPAALDVPMGSWCRPYRTGVNRALRSGCWSPNCILNSALTRS